MDKNMLKMINAIVVGVVILENMNICLVEKNIK